MRFPIPPFYTTIFEAYGIRPTQIMSNSWRIMSSFYIGYRVLGDESSLNVFSKMYALKRLGAFYVFEARMGCLLVYPKPFNHKGWKNTIVKFVSPVRFEINTA